MITFSKLDSEILNNYQDYIDKLDVTIEPYEEPYGKIPILEKRLVIAYMISEDERGSIIQESIVLGSNNNEYYSKFTNKSTIIPATTTVFKIIGWIPEEYTTIDQLKNDKFSNDEVCLGIEIPNQPHPDWEKLYKEKYMERITSIIYYENYAATYKREGENNGQ